MTVASKKRPRDTRKPPHRERAQPSRATLRVPATIVVAVILAGAAAWAYSTSFAGVLVLDDKFAIADNPNIKTLWPLTTAMSAPAESPVSARPIASLTLAINYALAPPAVRDVLSPGGPFSPPDVRERFLRNIWGYHFLNLLIHVLAALTFFGVIRRTLRSVRLRDRFGSASTALAFVASLIWVVHPLLTDAVTYVIQRTELLMGLFFFATLYCSIRAGEPGTSARARRVWTTATIVACALGMASKQTMVTAPLVVWLWDRMFLDQEAGDGSGSITPHSRRPLYAGWAATWALLAVLVAMERWPHSIGFAREGWTPWTYLLTQTGVIAHYVRLAIIPSPLALDYDGWPMATSVFDVAQFAVPLLIAFIVTVWAIVRRRRWGFLGGWFFATLAPSSSVLPLATEIAAERRMYLPLAALVVTAVIAVFIVGQRVLSMLVADTNRRHVIGTTAAAIVVIAVVAIYVPNTRARNRDFWSDEEIWRDTVEKRPTNPRARVSYGVDLYAAGRLEEAERELREAVRLKDTNAAAHANLGPVLCAQGKLDAGIYHLERALALDPDYTRAHANLGEAYAARGKRASAAEQFALAVHFDPDNPFLLNRLAWLLATSPEDSVRNGPRAVELAERAATITRREDVMSMETLSAAYAEAGRFEDAVTAGRAALALAEKQGNESTAADLARRLQIFQMRQPYREGQ